MCIEGAELELHSFLNSAADGCKWSTLHPGRFTSEKGPWDPFNRKLREPSSGCKSFGKGKNLLTSREAKPWSTIPNHLFVFGPFKDIGDSSDFTVLNGGYWKLHEGNVEKSNHKLTDALHRHLLERLKKATEYLSRNSRCPCPQSKWPPPRYKLKALPLAAVCLSSQNEVTNLI
jgi:hypothetical protein